MDYSEKMLTISIAAYNVQQYLDKLLASLVVPEVLDDLEVLVIDDGLADKTADIALKYVKKYPESFRLIRKENGGWGSTVNCGIRTSKGRYFKLIDGDDWFPTENMEEFILFLKKTNSDLIFTPFYEADDRTERITGIKGDMLKSVTGTVEAFARLPQGSPLAMHGMTVSTKFLRKNRIHVTENCFYADLEFVIKTVNCCKSIEVFHEPTYVYRTARGGQSVSNEGFAEHYQDNLIILRKLLQYCETELISKENEGIFAYRLNEAVQGQYGAFLCAKPSPLHKKELKEFDAWIRENYRSYYESCKCMKIRILRLTRFYGYGCMVRLHYWRQM